MNSKFRGALLGVTIGDCCGAVFEGEIFDAGQRLVLKNFLKGLEVHKGATVPKLSYTDDTAMTKSVGKCLLNYDPASYQKELAVNFVKEYFISPSRGYGQGVVQLFHQIRKNNFEDFLYPANQQFNGTGSFGNGAAMRISPVALYCLNKSTDFLIELAEKTSVVTHSNALGVNGAILQALAVQQNLKIDNCDSLLNVESYIAELIEKFRKVEPGEDEHGIPEEKYFTKQLQHVQTLLTKNFPPSDDEVVNILGHSVNALYSVPTAIYCFLRGTQSKETNNAFTQTLAYTISLGGDTDTIASMACALSGAFYGDTVISETLSKRCEASGEIIELADQIFKITSQ